MARHRPLDPAERALQRLAPRLDALTAPEPPAALVERTLARARAELAAAAPAVQIRRVPATGLPAGFVPELLRLLGATAAPLALVVAWNTLVVVLGPRLLAGWLPAPLALAVVVAYGLGALGWLALVYGSLPLVAHHRALARQGEAL